MSFISLNDLPGVSFDRTVLSRRADALRDRIDIYKRELCRLRNELESRNLAPGSIRLDPQLVRNEIGLVRRAVAKDLRRLARVEALMSQCGSAQEDAIESIDFSIVDPFEGRILSADARGLGAATATKTGAAQKYFAPLPAKPQQKAGMGEADDFSCEEFVGLDKCEDGLEIRASVVPEVVIAAQAPPEGAWKNNPVIEESGDNMADQSPDGGQYDYDGLSGAGGAANAFDYVMPSNGGSTATGLADSVDAGGVEPFVGVEAQDFSLDDGGTVSGDLVEPGTIPAETTNVEHAPPSREMTRRRRPSIANANSFEPGNGPAAMEPMRGPASPNGVPWSSNGGNAQTGRPQPRNQNGNANGNGGTSANGNGGTNGLAQLPVSRLDTTREIMRRQLAGAGMGQDDTSILNTINQGLTAAPGVINTVTGGTSTPTAPVVAPQNAISAYMPLILIGGGIAIAFGAWWLYTQKQAAAVAAAAPPPPAPRPVSANKKRRAKKAKVR